MTAKTRRFIVGSLAVLVTGLGVGLVGYYGGLSTGAFARQANPVELSYVPADAAVVAYADVHGVMTSELHQKLRALMPPEEKGQEQFKSQTGIDIATDIDYVVACVLPGDRTESGFAVLRGRFDAVRLESLAREHNAVVEEYKGKRIVRLQRPDRGVDQARPDRQGRPEASPAIAFLEPGLIMVGDVPAIRRGIDTQAGGHDVTDNAEVMTLVKDVDSGDAWAVGRLDILARRARLPQGVASQIPAVKWFAASGQLGANLSGVVKAEARDEQAAKNLRDVVNGFLALARMQSGDKPELQSLMESVTLAGSGTRVELSFTIPPQLLDNLHNLQNLRGPRRQQGALD